MKLSHYRDSWFTDSGLSNYNTMFNKYYNVKDYRVPLSYFNGTLLSLNYIYNNYLTYNSKIKGLCSAYKSNSRNTSKRKISSLGKTSIEYKIYLVDNHYRLSGFNDSIECEYICEYTEERNPINMSKNLMNMAMTDLSKKTDTIQDYAYNLAASKIKQKFGREIYLSLGAIDYQNPNDMVVKLFNKLVPGFDDKYRTSDGRFLPNFMIANKIGKGTFVYIASGIYIPDVKESLFYNKDLRYDLYIYVFGKHANYYYNKINTIITRNEKKRLNNSLYVVNSTEPRNYDITLLNFKNRDIESLVYSHNEDKIITRFIDKFLKDMEYYEKKQLNYKRGILLYSEPGTGKSSLVKALACKYKRSICQINIGSIEKINFNELTSMINADDDKYIVLFEDIDTLYLNREKEKKTEDGKTYAEIINGLLQFLDSTASPNNVIFIGTTNHYDRLDAALLRDGRFDLKLEVKPLEKKDIQRFINTLEFNGTVEEVLSAYGEPDENGLYNQSKLQNIILQLR